MPENVVSRLNAALGRRALVEHQPEMTVLPDAASELKAASELALSDTELARRGLSRGVLALRME